MYEEGLDTLLKKWDAKRGIQRDKVYKPLSVAKKEDLLSKIAWNSFAPGEYFFKQDKAKRYISEYIRNLPGASLDDEALQGDSVIVLRNIEAQHGLLVERAKNIYSFSHLTFQEYFTARDIIIVRQSSEEALQELVEHIFDKRWREVFLLAVALSSNAERLVLLMKEKIDNLLAEDQALQKYLQWLNEKSIEVDIRYSPGDAQKIQDKYQNIQDKYKFYANLDNLLFRIIYLNLDLDFNRNLNRNLSGDFYRKLYIYLYRNLNFYVYRNLNLSVKFHRNLSRDLYLYFNPNLILNNNLEQAKKCDPQLYEALLKLKKQLPDEEFKQWWQENGQTWSEDFRNAMIKYQNIGHDWQFSESQKALLDKYYLANQLLTQCLHHECYVSREVRQYIEETLLLPIAEIEKRKKL